MISTPPRLKLSVLKNEMKLKPHVKARGRPKHTGTIWCIMVSHDQVAGVVYDLTNDHQCKEWYHFVCIGLDIDFDLDDTWMCTSCCN